MERETVAYIAGASGEYRKYAENLSGILEYFAGNESNPENSKGPFAIAVQSLSNQIRELNNIASALDEIVLNYNRVNRGLEDLEIGFDEIHSDIEFGISEFAGLSKHERIMPIYSK